jgi:hypothetical protein
MRLRRNGVNITLVTASNLTVMSSGAAHSLRSLAEIHQTNALERHG